MGVSLSLLSVASTALIAAGCFAAGYLFASSSHQTRDDDDNDNNLCRRLFRWAPPILAGKPRAAAAKEADVDGEVQRGRLKARKPALEIENLAEILEDFKMVIEKLKLRFLGFWCWFVGWDG